MCGGWLIMDYIITVPNKKEKGKVKKTILCPNLDISNHPSPLIITAGEIKALELIEQQKLKELKESIPLSSAEAVMKEILEEIDNILPATLSGCKSKKVDMARVTIMFNKFTKQIIKSEFKKLGVE